MNLPVWETGIRLLTVRAERCIRTDGASSPSKHSSKIHVGNRHSSFDVVVSPPNNDYFPAVL